MPSRSRDGVGLRRISVFVVNVVSVKRTVVVPVVALALALAAQAPRRAAAASGDIRTVGGGAGNGNALKIGQQPAGVAVRGTSVYIADAGNHTVRKLDTSTGQITVIAGVGVSAAPLGDGGSARAASLYAPRGVAVDASGNVYIADTGNHRIRKVTPQGIISTVAGIGVGGYSGDFGPAVAARLSLPSGIALDGAGNLYIADYNNNRIRKVDIVGLITTVAGLGVSGYAGDGGPAVLSRLSFPSGIVATSAGTLYIADTANHRIRKVATNGTITTVAGSGVSGYSGDGGAATIARLNRPRGVGLNQSGGVLIADTINNRIRLVSAGKIASIAGNGTGSFSGDGGSAVAASLKNPEGVVSLGATVYAADTANLRVRRFVPGGAIATASGNGTPQFGDTAKAANAQFDNPDGLALDSSGNLYVADTLNHRVRKISPSGTISTIAGSGVQGYSGDGGVATAAKLSLPRGLALDVGGNLYIADSDNDRVRRVTPGGTISTVAGTGVAGFSGDNGPATSARLNEPSAVAVDASGRLYISDTGNNRVRRVTSGIINTFAGKGVSGATGDGGPAKNAALAAPRGLAVAGSDVYIADWANGKVRKVDGSGIITTLAGIGIAGFAGDGGPAIAAAMNGPRAVAVDGSRNVYISDAGNERIRRVDANGLISTIAGVGVRGYSGDGGMAIVAQIAQPSGIVVSGSGVITFSDTINHRLRRIYP